jgi:hypothetical protein
MNKGQDSVIDKSLMDKTIDYKEETQIKQKK